MKNEINVFKNYDDLPLMLQVKDVGIALGISRAQAYNLVHMQSFPKIKTGQKRICVPKQAFIDWITQQLQKCQMPTE